ncbi:hypothetical protein HDU67_009190 [Dinochytrium kinnereticum]|nr:hypothetical protein HDU67_009190 [Dinochytrium kinnereticum]
MSANSPTPIDPASKIFKVLLEPSPNARRSSKAVSWGKGSNARFHFTVHAYVSPEVEAAAEAEIESMKKDHQHGHSHKHDHDHDHSHKKDPKKRGEELQKRAKAFEVMLEQLKDSKPAKSGKKASAKTADAPADTVKGGKGESGVGSGKPPAKRKISDSRAFDEKPFEMRVGLGFSVPCLEKCVKTMQRLVPDPPIQGYAQLESVLRQEKKNKELIAKGLPPMKMFGCCAHANAEDTQANKDLLLLVGSPLEFEIDLISVQEPGDFTREIWEMTSSEKFAEAPVRKEEGTALYRAGDFAGACEKYARALMLLESLSLSPAVTDAIRNRRQEEEAAAKEERRRVDEVKRLEKLGQPIPPALLAPVKALKIDPKTKGEVDPDAVYDLMNTTRLNYAACKLKLGDLPVVVSQCSEVLKNDPGSVKALFRRAQAYARIGRDLDLAGNDLETLKNVLVKKEFPEGCSEWVELRREEKVLEKLSKASAQKEKKMYGNMFA